MAEAGWSNIENDAIVADYFGMLRSELSGKSYSKAAHNRDLQAIIGRSRGSIEYKHQNLSAVLKGLGEPWINGYKPAYNFQDSLIDAVARYLAARPQATQFIPTQPPLSAAEIEFGPAPTMRNAPPPDEAEQMMAVARRFDVAGMQARNQVLGRAGEERVVKHEIAHLRRLGREDLASRVRWVADLDGDGAGFDISSFEPSGAPRLIEVKTTNGWDRTPFHISSNELEVAEARSKEWCLVRLWNFAREPKGFEIRPPLGAHVSLTPTSYRAEFVGSA